MIRPTRLLCSLLFMLTGCGGSVWVQKGDALLEQERYDDAIEAYEQALRESPGDDEAERGMARARGGQAREIIEQAEENLEEGRYVEAMRQALAARSMPIDLGEVRLSRRIDRTIAAIDDDSDVQVERWLEQERYLDAVDLANALGSVDERRRSWASSVQAKAIEFYRGSAAEALAAGLPGAAATRLALAQSIGAELEASEIESAWTAFREPNCFSTPRVELQTKRRASPGALSQIKASVLSELERLQSRCGSGTQPLNVTVAVDVARISEDDCSVSAAQALPGVELETEEIYYEEVPYTEVEEVTTFDVTLELVERRDCAPRPGQRGCRTWTEEVEKKIPRVERREVEKIRRVERRRPLPGPFPKDKAVRFDKRVVSRQVQLRGEMRLLGEEASARFSIQAESSDESHPAVNERGVSLAADPLEVKSTEAVLAEAGKKLSETVRRGLERAVGLRGKELRLSAVRLSQEGKKLPAEENFLKKLVIGGDVDPDMT
ncbi:MAG: tetratricopeptide repeat protein, partial [Myxococcota bacterium]